MKAAVLFLAGVVILPSLVAGSDFGVLSITSPPDTVRQHSLNVPAALVHAAQGNADTEMVHVHLRIGSSYLAVDSARLAPGDNHVFSFVPAWQPDSVGSITARCSLLVQDADSTNNVLTKTVTVLAPRRDFAAAVLMAPAPIMRIGDSVVPLVLIRANDSNPQPESVTARLRIGTSYTDTVRKQLNPGENAQFLFKLWHASTLGTFPVRCSLLVHDSVPANDTLSRNVVVLARLVDFAAEAMTTVPPIVHVTDLVTPVVTVHAADGNPQPQMVTTRVWIGASFTDTTRMLVPPGAHVTYQFKQWQAGSVGTFQYRCSLMVHDSFAFNDTNRIPITVYPKGSDFSVVSITSPPDSVPLDSQVVPTALIHAAVYNQSESVSVRMRIGTSYDHTKDTVIQAGGAIYVTFPPWQAQPLGVTTARCTLLTPDNDSTNNAASKQVRVRRGQPLVWTRTFAGWGTARGNCVQQTADGGYIAAGRTSSSDSTPQMAILLAKVDSLGTTEWQRTIKASGRIEANSVLQTADGGYVVAGTEPIRVCIIKTDAQGNVLWQRTVNPSVCARGNSVVEVDDRGFAIVAQAPASDSGLLLYRTDSLGNLQWWRRYSVAYPSAEPVTVSLRRTSDRGFIIGTKALLKVDSLGNQQWLRTYSDVIGATSALQTPDGGYVATGPTLHYSDIYLLKTDATGNRQWIGTLASSETSLGFWLERTTDGGYVIAGSSYSGGRNASDIACLVRTTQDGMPLWRDSLCLGEARCVRQTRDGGYITTGARYDPSIGSDGAEYLLLTKLAPEQRGGRE